MAEIEEKWVLVKGESEGHPFFMMVNDGLKKFVDKNKFPTGVIATIELDEVQGHRLPTDAEAEILNEIEDKLVNYLSTESKLIVVGRETYFGEREILIYISLRFEESKEVLDGISSKLNKLRFVHLELHDDPSWNKAKRYIGS